MNDTRPNLRLLPGGAGHTQERHPDPPPEAGLSLRAAVEAVLLAATEPASVRALAAATGAPANEIDAALVDLAAAYEANGHGIEVAQVAGGYRLRTTVATHEVVRAFLGGTKPPRLGAAALEALAVVAYKQPVSRAQISAIRGVNSDSVVRTLLDRGYITEAGPDPEAPNVTLLGTTEHFLEHLGLNGLEDLPSLAGLEDGGLADL